MLSVAGVRNRAASLHVGELGLDLHLEISYICDIVIHKAGALVQTNCTDIRTYILGAQVLLHHLIGSIPR